MNFVLDATNGICWSIVYATAIILGFRHRTWYIPQLAICQNLSWEFLIVISRFQSGSFGFAFFIQFVWLLLDVGILITWILYDKCTSFIKKTVLLLLVFTALYTLAYKADKWEFAAFLINLIMSVEFIRRTYQNGHCPNSIFIATANLIGTLSATILYGLLYRTF